MNLVAITIEKARAIEEASHAEAARQSEVLKSALLDSLAHDIKTPLTSIKAAVTSLLGTAPEADRELLTIINEEADRLNQLAAEVIAMARVEAGKLHLEKRPVSAIELIDAALNDLAAFRRGRPINVLAPADLPRVECDPELIQHVVKQLVENALKYSPETAPLTISVARKGEKIVIGVADRGSGIDEDERAHIFDKFFRGRRYRFETKGTGMGLAIAKGIVEAHGEKIWVESEPGQGSAFYLSLPVARGGERLSAGKILVVDDDPQIRRVMKATLVGHGYEVVEARTGEDALEKFPQEMPTLVLLDMNMPGMGGLETCRSIRSGSDIPVIILSVRNTEKDKVAALDAGADDYVTKPFGIEELLARIRAAMRRSPSSSEGGPRGYTGRRSRDRFRHTQGTRQRQGRAPHAQGVRDLALPGGAHRPSRDPSRDSAGCVGAGLRRRTGIPARVHQSASQEDRSQSGETEIHPDRALGGVSFRRVVEPGSPSRSRRGLGRRLDDVMPRCSSESNAPRFRWYPYPLGCPREGYC